MTSTTIALLAFSLFTTGADAPADFVLRGATIYDGAGGEPIRGDVAIRADRIVAIGEFAGEAAREIDAAGLVVAPGFIDLHSHSDRGILAEKTRQNANYLMQGCTSVVTGNCGGGHVDVGDYLQKVDERGAGTNVLHLIPHGAVRREAMSDADRPAAPAEIEKMKTLVDAGMRDGAWGMSTGLIYNPGSFATTEELIELTKVVSRHGGIYASHMRNENTRLLESIDETLLIGRQGDLPVHISHFKASGREAWGLAAPAVEKVRAAREAGQRVTADQYPYIASSTSLSAMVVPAEYRGRDKLKAALADSEQEPKVREAIQNSIERRGNGASLFIAGYKSRRDWQGKDLATIAEQEKTPVYDLVLQIEADGGAQMINFGMQEEEVRLIMQQPFVAAASDGSAKDIEDDTVPHPRNYGTFPRKIGHYAIDGQLLPLALAIRSASGLPADILGLPERGYLRPEYYADVVVFDPDTFRDTATFEKPHQYASGVKYLFVNGQLAIDGGELTDALAGQAIRHQSTTAEKSP